MIMMIGLFLFENLGTNWIFSDQVCHIWEVIPCKTCCQLGPTFRGDTLISHGGRRRRACVCFNAPCVSR